MLDDRARRTRVFSREGKRSFKCNCENRSGPKTRHPQHEQMPRLWLMENHILGRRFGSATDGNQKGVKDLEGRLDQV